MVTSSKAWVQQLEKLDRCSISVTLTPFCHLFFFFKVPKYKLIVNYTSYVEKMHIIPRTKSIHNFKNVLPAIVLFQFITNKNNVSVDRQRMPHRSMFEVFCGLK